MKVINMLSETEKTKVLVVDDEVGIREGAGRILTRMGCEVEKAENGEQALHILENDRKDVVLLDLKMPGIDGMEVLNRVREMDQSIIVIIITGFATVETAIEAMKQGAYDFIPKPFEPDHLRIVVNRAMETIRLTHETEKLAREREKNLMDLTTEKSRIRTIIESMPNGLVVTNTQGKVVFVNPSFIRQMDLPGDTAPGRQISEYVADEGFCRMVMDISSGKYSQSEDIPTYEFAVGSEKFYLARGRAVEGEEGESLGSVITLVNITSMKMLDRLKSEFVAKVSHELRSPLSTIHEQLALVLQEMAQEESEKETHILFRAKEKTQGLISLIGDLLDISRIEAGMVCQESKPINVDALLKSIVDFMQARAKKKKQTLGFSPESEDMPSITADPIALESIFGNLVANAINYTPEGGEISVVSRFREGHIEVEVKDTGFGIDPKYHDKIFERFFRVKNADTRHITGTGLGLPIVKGLVDSLKGKITLESEPGKGTTFFVTIPAEGQD